MAPLPDTHPDGDPFAAQDAARADNSFLGRMEQRALLDAQHDKDKDRGALGFAPPKPAPGGKNGKPRSSTATLNGEREIVIDSSDDEEEEEEAQMTGGEDGDGASDDEDEDGSDSEGGDGEGEGSEGEGEGTPVVGAQEEEDDDDDDSEDDSDDDDSSKAGDGDVQMGDAGASSKPKSPVKSAGGANGEAGAAGDVSMKDGEAASAVEGGEAKPQKQRRKRVARSPTPPPPAPKAPQPTIRLEIALPPRKSADVPEFNIIELARAKGLIPPEEVKKPEEDEEGSESDGQGGRRKRADKGKGKADHEGTPEGQDPPKKRRKRGPNVVLGRFGGYDVHDPFVDDSEVALYEPRFYARPKREGYFVQTGDVEVVARKGRVPGSKNKPKLDENGNPVAPAARRRSGKVVVTGADGKPVHDTTAGPSTGSPAVTSAPAFGGAALPAQPPKPVRKKGEFSPELQADLDMLKRESDKEPWIVKNKFPPALKDLLISVAYHALTLNEYDDDFFAVMPKIFPYNLFTMKKLIKREVFPKRIDDYSKLQDEYLAVLQRGIDEGYPVQKADFERRKAEWERSQAEGGGSAVGAASSSAAAFSRAATPEAGNVPGFGDSPAIRTPLLAGQEGGAEGSPAPGKEDDKNSNEPKWRFRCTDQMRNALYNIGELEDRKSELIEEKQTLEKATTREVHPEKPHSAKQARKAMYQKIVNMWPQDAMTTNQLSREISNYKLKLKKQGELPSATEA
ncbi:hypothetical protein JCM8097_009365 [Rhodosporidiobolus ruineniae]